MGLGMYSGVKRLIGSLTAPVYINNKTLFRVKQKEGQSNFKRLQEIL